MHISAVSPKSLNKLCLALASFMYCSTSLPSSSSELKLFNTTRGGLTRKTFNPVHQKGFDVIGSRRTWSASASKHDKKGVGIFRLLYHLKRAGDGSAGCFCKPLTAPARLYDSTLKDKVGP